jgi:hypothetical protein
VTPITDDEFDELLTSFGREAIHLETRDAYGTAVELPGQVLRQLLDSGAQPARLGPGRRLPPPEFPISEPIPGLLPPC